MAQKSVFMKTDIICHEVKFEWEIKNALEILKTIHGEVITLDPTCKIKFKSALKVSKITDNVIKLFVGFIRADRSNETLTVITSLKLSDSNSSIFTRKTTKFSSPKSSKNCHWCISELFSVLDQKISSSDGKVVNCSDSDSQKSTTIGLTSSDSEGTNAKHLTNGLLIVQGTIKVYGCCVNSNMNSKTSFFDEKKVQDTKQDVINDINLAYESNLYTDICLKVSDCEIHTHKFILSARCPIFSRILLDNPDANVIEINDMSKNVLESLVRFLYTGVIGTLNWKTLWELYTIADKYEVVSLKKICSCSMKNHLKYSNVCEVLQLADTYNDNDLKIQAVNFITINLDNHTVANNFSEIVKNNPELASDVLKLKSFKDA